MLEKKQTLVVGAGVGGLAASIFLRRIGHQVAIFEQAEALGPVGAGILLPPAGQAVLRELGLLERVKGDSAVISRVRAEQSSGSRILDLRYESLSPSLRALGTPRHVLFNALREEAERSGVAIVPNSCVEALHPMTDGARVTTRDGRESHYPLVVVADGSRSHLGQSLGLRRLAIEYSHEALWTTGEIDSPSQDFLLQRMSGVRRLSGLLPLGKGQASFFWGMRKDEVLSDWDSFKAEALALMPEASRIIERLSADHVATRVGYRTTLHYPWYRGNVVLLGDAAHSMPPHLGQGASLALVDAARLGRALRAFPSDHQAAFSSYQRDRFWKSLYYTAASLVTSPFFQSDWGVLASFRNFVLPLLQRFPWIERQMVSTMSGLKAKLFVTRMREDELGSL
jgi:2-polyprenyl-6-methoxyphenol hydroxylase-like FAD-dependent oxidoreductase